MLPFFNLSLIVPQVVVSDVFIGPFCVDKEVHPAKETKQNNESSDHFKHEDLVFLEVDSVETLDHNTVCHMENTNDDSHLHFERILHDQNLAFINKPSWILTEKVGAVTANIFILICKSFIAFGKEIDCALCFCSYTIEWIIEVIIVARSEPVRRNSEELVVQ